MKNKIIYAFILVFSISLIASAKKISGCNNSSSCQLKQNSMKEKVKKESKAEPASLSLFFFNI